MKLLCIRIFCFLADDLDNAGIATYATQRIHESGVRCGL